MSHFRLRCEFADGRTVEVTPTEVDPLTVAQLQRSVQDPSAAIEFAFDGTDAVVNGARLEGFHRVTTKITFPHSPAPYALVSHGWLPMPFAIPQHFLVDRNVVATLRAIRTRGPRPNDASFHWWTHLFEAETCLFNPLLYAYEGHNRCLPSMSEFASSYTEGVAELELSLPRANVVRYQAEHFDAAYGQLQALANRGERDAKFLVSAVPLVLNRVSRNRQDAVQKDILALARQFQVINCAPVVLAVLSVLYEEIDGKSSSIGRKLLKPTAAYSPEDAYNAVSDLRHIELAALSHAVLPEQAFALCTNDRGIAAFWSALKFRGKATEDSLLNLYYSLGTDLFPRLCQDEVNAVAHALRE